MVERCTRTFLVMLKAVVSEQQDHWDDHLPVVLSAYRSTPHSSTGYGVLSDMLDMSDTMSYGIQCRDDHDNRLSHW